MDSRLRPGERTLRKISQRRYLFGGNCERKFAVSYYTRVRSTPKVVH